MKRIGVFAATLVFVIAGPLMACDKEAKAQVAGAKKGCCPMALKGAVAEVMKDMPKMTYRVGDFETCCFDTASAKAGENGKVVFVVGDKSYEDKTAATVALAEALEQQAEALNAVTFAVGEKSYHCPMAAQAACKGGEKVQYRLAGFNFDSQEKADEAAKMIRQVLTGQADGSVPPCCANCKGDKKDCCDKCKAQGGCAKAKAAAQVAGAEDKGGCPHAAAQVAGAEDKGGCPHAAAQVAAGEQKGGCDKAKAAAQVAGAEKPACCAKEAEARVAAAQSRLQLIIETAATVALSS